MINMMQTQKTEIELVEKLFINDNIRNIHYEKKKKSFVICRKLKQDLEENQMKNEKLLKIIELS